mmetsp:Transcript_34334/g.91814  ORF Transcript_34334/g.91814 Transcript_34334/m.91814 type:complete len:219 (+) Transcript_34334:2418-3074(+)
MWVSSNNQFGFHYQLRVRVSRIFRYQAFAQVIQRHGVAVVRHVTQTDDAKEQANDANMNEPVEEDRYTRATDRLCMHGGAEGERWASRLGQVSNLRPMSILQALPHNFSVPARNAASHREVNEDPKKDRDKKRHEHCAHMLVVPSALPVDHMEMSVALDASVVRSTSGTSTDVTRVALGPHGRLVATRTPSRKKQLAIWFPDALRGFRRKTSRLEGAS